MSWQSRPDTFTYDGFGRMTSSYVNGVTTTYAYRGDGLRKSKTTNGVTTQHVWDGDQIVQDLDGIDLVREYVRGIRLIDTYSPASPERIAYIQNARGDVVGHINNLTTVIDFVDYDAFGNLDTGVLSDPLAYCGEYLDSETGFIYLRARYYDPNLGRFTTEDPARDGLNWYVYCNNNPVNFVDPWGLAPGDEFDSLEAALRDAAEYYMGVMNSTKTEKQEEELVGFCYLLSNGNYTYRSTYNRAKDKSREFYVDWGSSNPVAVIHTHVFYTTKHNNDNFSKKGNTASKSGYSDYSFVSKSGIPLAVVAPTGEVRLLNTDLTITEVGEVSKSRTYTAYRSLSSRTLWHFIQDAFPEEDDRVRIVRTWSDYTDGGTKELTSSEQIAFLKEIGMMK